MATAAPQAAGSSSSANPALRRAGEIALSFAGFLLLWEVAVRLFDFPQYILPAPSLIWKGLVSRFPTLITAAGYTAQPMLWGYAAAVIFGVLIALGVAFVRVIEVAVYPLIVFLQIVPKIAVAPLFIIWFGFGLMPKVLLVFLLSFFPVVVSSIQAFRSVDADIMDLARSTGASAWRIFLKVQLPHALPTLFTGFKVAAALSATAAVVAEFVASDRGLGYLLLEYNGNLETALSFAAILVLSVLGLALYAVVELIERIAIPWHVSQRAGSTGIGNP
jgi:NitT/TauT family transport system permease protein